jgi:hypothetical protein
VLPQSPAPEPSIQVPAQPPQFAQSDFDFARGGPSPRQENLDFEEAPDTGMDRIRARNRARAAASWAYTSVAIDFVIALIFVFNSFSQDAPGQNRMAGLVCFFVIFIPIVVFVLIGASNLTNLQGWGLVITGAIMALIAGALLVILCLFLVYVLIQALNLRINPPAMFFLGFLVYAAGAAFSIVAGIKLLIAANNPDVRAFLPGNLEDTQGVRRRRLDD